MKYNKALATFFIASLLQVDLAKCQGYGGHFDCGTYFVPYHQDGSSSPGPIRYVPVQGSPPAINAPVYSIQNAGYPSSDKYPPSTPYLPNGPYPPNSPYPSYPPNGPFNTPIYSNSPTVSYQGLDEANALRSSYPNQPIIIINNGGNGDTGGNSNNGNNNNRDKDRFNFGDLAAIFLATKHHRGKGGPEGRDFEPPEAFVPPPPVTPSQGVNPGFNHNFGNNNAAYNDRSNNNPCNTVTHITIVLPSLGGPVSAEDKKEKDKDVKRKEKKKRKKDDHDEDNDDDDHDDDIDDEDAKSVKKELGKKKKVEDSGDSDNIIDDE